VVGVFDPLKDQCSPEQVVGDFAVSLAGQNARHANGTGARAAGKRFTWHFIARDDFDELDIDARREPRIVFDFGADF